MFRVKFLWRVTAQVWSQIHNMKSDCWQQHRRAFHLRMIGNGHFIKHLRLVPVSWYMYMCLLKQVKWWVSGKVHMPVFLAYYEHQVHLTNVDWLADIFVWMASKYSLPLPPTLEWVHLRKHTHVCSHIPAYAKHSFHFLNIFDALNHAWYKFLSTKYCCVLIHAVAYDFEVDITLEWCTFGFQSLFLELYVSVWMCLWQCKLSVCVFIPYTSFLLQLGSCQVWRLKSSILLQFRFNGRLLTWQAQTTSLTPFVW